MKKQSLLAKNMMFNAIYKCVYILFPMITIPYLSRVILVDGIGKVDFSTSIVNYFLIFASLGIPQYGVREIAKVKANPNDLSKTFSEIFTINLVSTIFCVALYYPMIFFVPYFAENKVLFGIMGILLMLNIFKVDWFFQGMEQYGYIAVRSIIVKVISLVLIITFVKKPEDYIIYAIIYVFAQSGNDILNVIRVRRFVKLTFKGLKVNKHFKAILILVSTQLAINIYINLDITMLGVLSGDTAVGIYTNASKLSKLVVTVITSICVVLLPRMSTYLKENNTSKIDTTVNKMLELLLLISIPITIGIFLVSEDIVFVLFGPSFTAATITIKILTWLIIILSVGNLFGTQVLMTFGEESKLLISVIVGAFINFSFNIFLIPKFAQNGAAIATLIAEIIVLFLQVYMALKYVHIKINLKRFSSIIIGNIFIIIIVSFLKLHMTCGFTRLVVSTLCSSLMYLIINIMMKNSLVYEMISKIKK